MKKYIFLGLLVVASLFSSKTTNAQEKLSIVINPSVPAKEMSFSEAKGYVKASKSRWSDKTKVKLALMKPGTAEGKAVADKFFGGSASGMNKHYLSLAFQGKIEPPRFFNSASELINYVNSTPGSIGVVSATNASAATRATVDGANEF